MHFLIGCWSTIRTRRYATIGWHCWASCAHCFPGSPTCRACRGEHDRTVAVHRFAGVHGVFYAVDLFLRDLLRRRLPVPAVPRPLRTGARVGAGDSCGAALELPARTPGGG